MKTVAIVIARMGGTRLPGKVMMDLAGKPVLLRVLERASISKQVDKVVVALPDSPDNVRIEKLCASMGYACFKGSELDVVDRVYRTAVAHCAEEIVLLRGDCPFVDSVLIESLLVEFRQNPSILKYASNGCPSRTFPTGLDVAVLGADTLQAIWRNARETDERERIAAFIEKHDDQFRIISVNSPSDCSQHSLAIDTLEDLRRGELIFSWFGKECFGWEEAVRLFESQVLTPIERGPEPTRAR